jgi:hypothetical protein
MLTTLLSDSMCIWLREEEFVGFSGTSLVPHGVRPVRSFRHSYLSKVEMVLPNICVHKIGVGWAL